MNKYSSLHNLKHRFRLIGSKFPSNIRMFVGASIYGDLTSRFVEELFITKDKFEKEHNSFIDDWTQIPIDRNNKTKIKNITHAEIVRKPQYRGRPTYNLQRRSMGISASATNRYRSRLGNNNNNNNNTSTKPNTLSVNTGGSGSGDTNQLSINTNNNNNDDEISVGPSPIPSSRRTVRFGKDTKSLLDPKT
eukprot:326057_1